MEKETKRCIVSGDADFDLHHIYSRKAWPQLKDKDWNQIPLCRALHCLWHSQGAKHMSDTYPQIKRWLLSRGWHFDDFSRKWMHDKEVKIL